MKILVIGSLRDPVNENDQPNQQFVNENQARFEAACIALGEALARKDHLVMVGVPDWSMLKERKTVATFIVEGINKAPLKNAEKHPVIFYGPQEREPADQTPDVKPDTLQELKTLENINIEDKFVGSGTSKARVIPNVTEVDAVMLISGREGTESIGYAAYSMGKPVIAITSLCGAAEAVAKEVLIKDYNQFLKQGDVTPNDLRALDVNWDDDPIKNLPKAEEIVNTGEKLVKAYNQPGRQTRNVLLLAIVGLVVLLLVWIWVYLSANQCTASDQGCPAFLIRSFFALLFISALLGSGLRTLVQYQENRVTNLTFRGLGIDVAISLIVAFGLALLYLIGGISFTGKVVVLDTKNTANGDTAFTTVAISMSLLGLAAGYLVPLKKLAERLENIVAQENK